MKLLVAIRKFMSGLMKREVRRSPAVDASDRGATYDVKPGLYRMTDEAATALALRAWEPPLPTLVDAQATLDEDRIMHLALRFASAPLDDDLSREAISIIETEIICDVPRDAGVNGFETRVLPSPSNETQSLGIWPKAIEYVSPICDLIGRKLAAVTYGYTAVPIGDLAPSGFDIAEMISLQCDGLDRTIWISEGVTDTLAVGTTIDDVVHSYEAIPAEGRKYWSDLVGRTIVAVSVTSVRVDSPRARQAIEGHMIQAIHLSIDDASVVTIAGCRPPDAGPDESLDAWCDVLRFDDLVPQRNHGFLRPMQKRITIPLSSSSVPYQGRTTDG